MECVGNALDAEKTRLRAFLERYLAFQKAALWDAQQNLCQGRFGQNARPQRPQTTFGLTASPPPRF